MTIPEYAGCTGSHAKIVIKAGGKCTAYSQSLSKADAKDLVVKLNAKAVAIVDKYCGGYYDPDVVYVAMYKAFKGYAKVFALAYTKAYAKWCVLS